MNTNPDSIRFHRIRLHGPWLLSGLSQTDEPKPKPNENETKIKLPGGMVDWADSFSELGIKDEFQLARKFGLPTELDPEQKIWLVVECVNFDGCVWLNDQDLGNLAASEPFRVEVRDWLRPRNHLKIQSSLSRYPNPNASQTDSCIHEVRIEIEESQVF